MNNTYFNKDIFPDQNQFNNNTSVVPANNSNYTVNALPLEQSFIENILRLNIGKKVTVHMTFPYSNDSKSFQGILEQSGRDFVIVSEPSTGKWQLMPMMYINFISFDENINYSEFNLNNWFFYKKLL